MLSSVEGFIAMEVDHKYLSFVSPDILHPFSVEDVVKTFYGIDLGINIVAMLTIAH